MEEFGVGVEVVVGGGGDAGVGAVIVVAVGGTVAIGNVVGTMLCPSSGTPANSYSPRSPREVLPPVSHTFSLGPFTAILCHLSCPHRCQLGRVGRGARTQHSVGAQ